MHLISHNTVHPLRYREHHFIQPIKDSAALSDSSIRWGGLRFGGNVLVMLVLILLMLPVDVFAQPDTLWTRTYGENPNGDGCLRIIKTYDGGFFLGGYTWSVENVHDFFVVKTDSTGEEQWTGQYRWEHHDLFYGIAQTPDSGFVMCGSLSEGWIAKVDAGGNLEWANGYAGDGGYIQDLKVGRDGQIIAVGLNGNGDAYLALIDEEGEVIWDEAYGGRGTDRFCRVITTRDNDLVMVGSTRSFGNGVQAFIVKVDSAGREEWTRDFGGPQIDDFNSVVETEDGELVAAGGSEVDGDLDFYVVKVDADGDEIWSRTYPHRDSDWFGELISAPGGGFLLVGDDGGDPRRNNLYCAYRLDEEGEVLWELDIGDFTRGYFTSAVLMDDGGYAIAGERRVSQYSQEFWLVRTAPDPVSVPRLLDPIYLSSFSLHTPYPNPFNSYTQVAFDLPVEASVSICVYDITGKEVIRQPLEILKAGNHQFILDGKSLATGCYFLNVKLGNNVDKYAKLVLIR